MESFTVEQASIAIFVAITGLLTFLSREHIVALIAMLQTKASVEGVPDDELKTARTVAPAEVVAIASGLDTTRDFEVENTELRTENGLLKNKIVDSTNEVIDLRNQITELKKQVIGLYSQVHSAAFAVLFYSNHPFAVEILGCYASLEACIEKIKAVNDGFVPEYEDPLRDVILGGDFSDFVWNGHTGESYGVDDYFAVVRIKSISSSTTTSSSPGSSILLPPLPTVEESKDRPSSILPLLDDEAIARLLAEHMNHEDGEGGEEESIHSSSGSEDGEEVVFDEDSGSDVTSSSSDDTEGDDVQNDDTEDEKETNGKCISVSDLIHLVSFLNGNPSPKKGDDEIKVDLQIEIEGQVDMFFSPTSTFEMVLTSMKEIQPEYHSRKPFEFVEVDATLLTLKTAFEPLQINAVCSMEDCKKKCTGDPVGNRWTHWSNGKKGDKKHEGWWCPECAKRTDKYVSVKDEAVVPVKKARTTLKEETAAVGVQLELPAPLALPTWAKASGEAAPKEIASRSESCTLEEFASSHHHIVVEIYDASRKIPKGALLIGSVKKGQTTITFGKHREFEFEYKKSTYRGFFDLKTKSWMVEKK